MEKNIIQLTFVIISSLSLCTIIHAQYNFGLDVCGLDGKIEGKLFLEDGSGNVLIGKDAGLFNTENDIVAIGNEAGRINEGFHNLFVGGYAGQNNTTGVDNTFVGFIAGQSNTTGFQNDFIGGWTGINNTTDNSI